MKHRTAALHRVAGNRHIADDRLHAVAVNGDILVGTVVDVLIAVAVIDDTARAVQLAFARRIAAQRQAAGGVQPGIERHRTIQLHLAGERVVAGSVDGQVIVVAAVDLVIGIAAVLDGAGGVGNFDPAAAGRHAGKGQIRIRRNHAAVVHRSQNLRVAGEIPGSQYIVLRVHIIGQFPGRKHSGSFHRQRPGAVVQQIRRDIARNALGDAAQSQLAVLTGINMFSRLIVDRFGSRIHRTVTGGLAVENQRAIAGDRTIIHKRA